MAKISTFIISILVVAAMVTVFVAFYASLSTKYEDVTYQDNISGFDQFDDIDNITTQLSGQLENQTVSTGGFNIIGDFLSTGYNALKVTWQSMTSFNKIVNSGFSNIPVGDDEGQQSLHRLQLLIGTIVFIAILFILIAVLTNRGDI